MLPGNSGGPLLDEACRVMGVNTFINRQTQLRLRQPRQIPQGPGGQVGRQGDAAEIAVRDQTAAGPWSVPGRAPMPRIAVSKERIRQLSDAAAAFAWKPRKPEDYQKLTNLAAMMTVCKRPQAPPDLAAFADQVFAKLKQMPWTNGQVNAINQYAAGRIATPGHGAVFVGVLVGKGNDPAGKATGLMLQVPGVADLLLVPARGEILNTRPGSRLLGVGSRPAGRAARSESPASPNRSSFRVIQSSYLLPMKLP